MIKYDYIQVDPKVIQMLGGDETMESVGDDLGADLPNETVASYGKKSNFNKMFEDVNNQPVTVMPSVDSMPGLLQEILNELREIKEILAGR